MAETLPLSVNYDWTQKKGMGSASAVRGFALKNYKNGKEISLNGPLYFALNPKGLGINISNEISTVNSTRYLMAQDYEPDDISFDLVVAPSATRTAYQNFYDFASILQGGNVTLGYRIPNITNPSDDKNWYYRDLAVKSLDKTELTDGDSLVCTMTFEPLSFWYYYLKPNLNNIADEPDLKETTGISKTISKSFSCISIFDKLFKCEILLKAVGNPINNPSWSQNNYDNLVHTGFDGYNIQIPKGQVFVVGNMYDEGPYAYLTSFRGTVLQRKTGSSSRELLKFQMPGGSLPFYINSTSGSFAVTIPNLGISYEAWVNAKIESPLI